VLLDQPCDAVGHADQEEYGGDDPIRRRLDRVGEEDARIGIAKPIELVEEDGEAAVVPFAAAPSGRHRA
jgi:hypothetical protein